MKLDIIWSRKAALGYSKILQYLDEEWTEREVKNFENEVNQFLKKLSTHPSILKGSKDTNLRRGPINKLTMLTYRVDEKKNQLQLINIRGARQKPMF